MFINVSAYGCNVLTYSVHYSFARIYHILLPIYLLVSINTVSGIFQKQPKLL